MSTCISSHGEYSSHELDATFTCTLCGVLDEETLRAELGRLNAKLAEAKRRECTALCTDVDAGSRYAARDAVVEAAKALCGAWHDPRVTLLAQQDAADGLAAAVAALPSSSDGAGQTGCPNCDGLDGTHTLRSCLAMADVERYRSFVAPGFDCPECLVDTGDSAHMVSCSIGRRLGCATRTDGAGQTDEATWRDYTIHPLGQDGDVAVMCRSDKAGMCEDIIATPAGRYLTLGEAVDWSNKHIAWHAELDEPVDLDDLKRRAEVLAPGVTDQLHNLLGCTWGDTIAIKGYSDDPCPSKATQVVVLHQDGTEHAFKLCGPHAELVKDETTPHESAASVSAPAEEKA